MVKFTIGAKLADAVTGIEFAQLFTLTKQKGWFSQSLRRIKRDTVKGLAKGYGLRSK